jgi:hypothetical protein
MEQACHKPQMDGGHAVGKDMQALPQRQDTLQNQNLSADAGRIKTLKTA